MEITRDQLQYDEIDDCVSYFVELIEKELQELL